MFRVSERIQLGNCLHGDTPSLAGDQEVTIGQVLILSVALLPIWVAALPTPWIAKTSVVTGTWRSRITFLTLFLIFTPPPYIKNHRENNSGKYPPYMSIGF